MTDAASFPIDSSRECPAIGYRMESMPLVEALRSAKNQADRIP